MGLTKKHQWVRNNIYSLDLPESVKKEIWLDYQDAEKLIAEETAAGKAAQTSAALSQKRYRARLEAEKNGTPIPAWARRRQVH